MSDSPGVVTVHRFVQAKNAKGSYSDYAVGYMGRPEAFDEEKHLDDTLYHDSNPLRDVGEVVPESVEFQKHRNALDIVEYQTQAIFVRDWTGVSSSRERASIRSGIWR